MTDPARYDVLLQTREHVEPRDPAAPAERDRTPSPWESSMQATCECLSWRGSLDNLERRQAEDALGETLYAEFPVHTRSALVVTHRLLDEGVIAEDELRAKMAEVRARMERE
ncbi:MAG TPA: hypothetical protein VIL49_00235 [Capillimicrobium sp.]